MVSGIDPRTLSHLAAFDRRVYECRAAIAAGKRKVSDLEALEAEYVADLDSTKQSLRDNKIQTRTLEGEIEDLRRQVKTHNHRLNEITDTREFRALSDEIRYIQRQIEDKEEELLKLMEEAERLGSEESEKATALEEKRTEVNEGRSKIEEERERHESDLTKAAADLDTFLASVPERTVKFYRRQADRMDMPVVWANKDACGYCHHRLTPQARLEVRSSKSIVVCESCGRMIVAATENNAQPSQ